MELIISLAMKFWMWTILIIVVILGSLINLLDKKKPRCYTFTSNKMPVLRPIPIKTKGKATSVNLPAPKRLNRIPSNIIPIRSNVVAQNLNPFFISSRICIVFAISMPKSIAIIISLIGERSKPNIDSPIHAAIMPAKNDTETAILMPITHPGLIVIRLDNVLLLMMK